MSQATFTFSTDLRIPQAQARVQNATGRALFRAGEYVAGEAVQRAPIKEGTLRRSVAVKHVDEQTVQVGFHTPYAVRQHEELGYRHPKGGQAKYLESVLTDNRDTILQILAQSVRGVIS